RPLGDGRRGHQHRHSAASPPARRPALPARGRVHPVPGAEARRGTEEEVALARTRQFTAGRSGCGDVMPWLSVTLEVDAAQADTLSDALLEAGAHSVALEPAGEGRQRLQALVAQDADAARTVAQAAQAASLTAAPDFAPSPCEDAEWERRTQAQFAPIAIDERLWIGPSWHAVPPAAAGAAVARLDPGLAFGTGTHPSTRLTLQFLARTVRGGERVLDYGCGSGILAIAACKLGAGEVVAVDIDPEAVRATEENA